MTAGVTAALAPPACPVKRYRVWWPVAAAMFVIGWGGNQFTPLLVAYRAEFGFTVTAVDVLLGAYVVGLVPGLLIASALSDRYGRRPVLVSGVACSVAGSLGLGVGDWTGFPVMFGARVLSGLAVGIAMSVGTAWINELSTPTHDPSADEGSGSRRSMVALTLGLGLGPGTAGLLAQWSPMPLVVPYVVQIAMAVPALVVLAVAGVETRRDAGELRLLHRLRVPRPAIADSSGSYCRWRRGSSALRASPTRSCPRRLRDRLDAGRCCSRPR